MSEIENTPSADEGVQATPTDSAPQPIVEPQAEEPAPAPVNLEEAAGEVAAQQPRSLDELSLDEQARTKVESYISRQINDAREKWETRKQQEIEDGKFMTRDEVASYYQEATERGLVNPQILSDPDGLQMLAKLSGALPEEAPASMQPSQGLPKTHPAGLEHGDGSIQLGAVLAEGQEMPAQMRIEKAMIEAMRDSQ